MSWRTPSAVGTKSSGRIGLNARRFFWSFSVVGQSLDLFSTNLNHQLTVYFSPVLDTMSAGTDAMLQSWDGLEVYAFPPFALVHQVLLRLRQSRGVSMTLVAPFWPQKIWFPELLDLLVAFPTHWDLLHQPHFHCLHQNLCVATVQRAARRQGLSSAVARQLVFCRRRSTRLNYQSKWSIYRSWCCCHGRSVSRPSIAKILDFLLFLRRQRSLSYSNISGFGSMLSTVFHFSLPELSSSSIIRDLLRSLRLERPSVPLRAPPWDLSCSSFSSLFFL